MTSSFEVNYLRDSETKSGSVSASLTKVAKHILYFTSSISDAVWSKTYPHYLYNAGLKSSISEWRSNLGSKSA